MSSSSFVMGSKGKPREIPFEALWEVMIDKIYRPDKFLPVNAVACEQKEDHVWRTMTFTPTGTVIVERIYILKNQKRINFDHNDRDERMVNAYIEGEKVIEYWRETQSDGKRLTLPMDPIAAIERTYEFAAELKK